MENVTAYTFKATNGESYDSLAAYLVNTTLNASFFPKSLIIVVISDKDEKDFKEVGRFIVTEGLDFVINPATLNADNEKGLIENEVASPCNLRALVYKMLAEKAKDDDVISSLQTRLSACEGELGKVRQDKERYNKWWNEESTKRVRLEDAIKALRALLDVVIE